MRVRVLMAFSYDLPDDEQERTALYGTTDPGKCLQVDLENDPVWFLTECDSEVVSWTVESSG